MHSGKLTSCILLLLAIQAPSVMCQMSAEQYLDKGDDAIQKHLYDEAIANYTKAIELNPNITAAYSNRGAAYVQKHLWEKALTDFNKALKLNLTDDETLVNRGAAYGATGQYDKAIADFEEALFFDAKNVAAQKNLEHVRKLKADSAREAIDESKSQHSKGGDVIDQVISEAAQETKNNKRSEETKTLLSKEEQKGLSEAM